MPYIPYTDEQKQLANNVDLPTFLRMRGETLERVGREYKLIYHDESGRHDSITMRGSHWFDHKNQIGGGPVKFMQEHYGMGFQDAMQALLGYSTLPLSHAPSKEVKAEEKREFKLPESNDNMHRVYAYLIKQRFIAPEVITHFAKKKLLYEDKNHHNAVFVGVDGNGVPRQAHKRSTTTFGNSFRQTIEGSDTKYSFAHFGTSQKLFVFETPIDLMSFLTLYPKDWEQHSYIAMNGVYEGAVLTALKEHSLFLQGVKDSCEAWGGKLLGGNVKDGKEFSVTGTAIGGQVYNNILTRIGSNIGDAVCIVGDPGIFWLAILKLLEGCSLKDLDDYTKSFVKSPYPKIKEGLLLSSSNIVTSCMDNSDGIIGCLYELATLNNVSIMIDDCKLVPDCLLEQFCRKRNIDYRNLMLSFGGWDLVFTCPMSEVTNLQRLFEKNNSKFHVIGEVTKRSAEKVMLVKDDFVYKINDFSSKRFNKHSYFSFGLDAFIEHFRKSQLEKLDTRRADL